MNRKLFWIFVISTLLISLALFFLRDKPKEASIRNDEIEFIQRISSGKNLDYYSLGGSKFSLPKNSTVSISNGPDFSVYQIVINEKDTFGLFSGMYPRIPNELEKYVHKQKRKNFYYSDETEKKLEDIIKYAKTNGSYNSKIKMHEEYDYELDTMIPPKFDSLNMTLYSDELKNIWILQPSKNDIGELDIIIENNDKYSSFHLFGSQLNQEQRNRAIEISKSVK